MVRLSAGQAEKFLMGAVSYIIPQAPKQHYSSLLIKNPR